MRVKKTEMLIAQLTQRSGSLSLSFSSISFYSHLVYEGIDDVVKAMRLKDVDGMFLDRYTASFYQSRDKLKALLTVKKLELQRDVGVLFSKDRKELAECLNFLRSTIWRSVQTITETFKVTNKYITKTYFHLSYC